MRRLYPPPTGSDAALELEDLYADLELPAGPVAGERAGVALGMVTSLDGATAVDGVSGGLGGDADAVAFARLRSACDAIVVGAGTVRAEDYGPPAGDERRRAERRDAGRSEVPAMVVVTRSAQLSPDARLFTDPRREPDVPLVVATCRSAPPERRAALGEVAEVLVLGEHDVDLHELLVVCRRRGWERVLGEGGPGLNGQLLADGLVDEILVTVAPSLVAGDAARLVTGPALASPVPVEPVAIHLHGAELLLRYRVRR